MIGTLNLVGGRLCLDFCNTMRGEERRHDSDLWQEYGDLVEWGTHVEVVGPEGARRLHAAAADDPVGAQRALRTARRLREAMYRAFRAEARGLGAAEDDLEVINQVLMRGTSRRRLRPSMRGASWSWDEEPASLEGLLWPVAWSAGELLTSSRLERVKECGGCSWLFVDASRNRSRRWCDMRDCGNREKVRRHRRKHAG